MPWPLSQDYNEAVQNPESSFADPELRRGEVATNAMGLPMPCSGNFADVYRLNCPASQRSWAVKCFTRQIPGLRERYQQISSHLQQGKPSFMVDFTFLDRGIQVRGDWYPILKMQWVEGLTLNQFVKSNLDKPKILDMLCQLWVKLAVRLREANMAHCDLQHGNVLLVPAIKGGSLHVRLVDYDGMCVPALTLLKSIEMGHPSYQHPQRLREGIYSLEVDRFSHLVIYTALRSLMVGGPALWQRYDNGDNLLFCQQDFQAPAKSRLFYELLKVEDASVRSLAEQLIETVRQPLEQAPLVEQFAAVTPSGAAVVRKTGVRSQAAAVNSGQSVPSGPVPTGGTKPTAPSSSVPGGMAGMKNGVGQDRPGLSPFDQNLMTEHGGGIAQAKRRTGVHRAASSSKKRAMVIAVCVSGLLLAGLVGLLAGGVFRVQTRDGVLVVQVNEPNADVYVDGEKVTVTWAAGGNKAEIHVKPGTRQVSVKKDGFTAYGTEVTLEDGGRQIITARLEKTPGGLAKARTPELVGEGKATQVQRPPVPDPVAKPQPPPIADPPRAATQPPQPPTVKGKVESPAQPDLAQPARNGSPSKDRLYVVSFGKGAVTVVDPGTQRILKSFPLPTNGCSVALSPDNQRAYIAYRNGDRLAVVDLQTGKVHFIRGNIGWNSHSVLLDRGSGMLYLATSGGTPPTNRILVIDPIRDQVTTEIAVGLYRFPSGFLGFQLDPKARQAFATTAEEMVVLDLRERKVLRRLPFPGGGMSSGLRLSPDSRTLYVGSSEGIAAGLLLLDTTNFEFRRLGSVNGATNNPVASPDGKRAYAILNQSRIIGVQVADGKEVLRAELLEPLTALAISGDGQTLYAASPKNKVFVLDAHSGKLREPIPIDSPYDLQWLANPNPTRLSPTRPEPPGVKIPQTQPAGFVPLFNSKDLTGWKDNSGGRHRWRVENGIIVGGRGPGGASHLESLRGDFDNFHLRVETMLSEGANSSIEFRSGRAFIGGTAPGNAKTGDLVWGLTPLMKAPPIIALKPMQWFTEEVIAVGNHVTIRVNGAKVIDYTHPDRKPAKGSFGLMCRGGAIVRFRKIEVKELSLTAAPPPEPPVASPVPTDRLPRELWVQDHGYFIRGLGKDWFEKWQDGRKPSNLFYEAQRTNEFVELRHYNYPVTIQLYKDKALVKDKRSTPELKVLYEGKWHIKPTVSAHQSRQCWVQDHGYFFPGLGKDWFEKWQDGSKPSNLFCEVQRTNEFVELRHYNYPVTIELYMDKALVKDKRSTPELKVLYEGKWQ